MFKLRLSSSYCTLHKEPPPPPSLGFKYNEGYMTEGWGCNLFIISTKQEYDNK